MASAVPNTSLSAGSGVASGTTIDFLTAKKTVTAAVTPSAILSAGVVTIEASQDNSNWITLRVVGLDSIRATAVSFEGVAFRYWRANVAQALSGGTVRVTFMEAD